MSDNAERSHERQPLRMIVYHKKVDIKLELVYPHING
jgi:hypothetical protein